jgi:hypothetical protein
MATAAAPVTRFSILPVISAPRDHDNSRSNNSPARTDNQPTRPPLRSRPRSRLQPPCYLPGALGYCVFVSRSYHGSAGLSRCGAGSSTNGRLRPDARQPGGDRPPGRGITPTPPDIGNHP